MMAKQIDIEDLLVWAYQVQCVDKLRLQSFSQAGAMDSCRRLELAVVDGSANVGHDCHPDAEAVHFAVLWLSKVQQALIIGNAKNGTRPDCLLGARMVMAAVVGSNGNPRRIYGWDKKTTVGHMVAPAMELPGGSLSYAPYDRNGLKWFDEVVSMHRMQYLAWREAMDALVLSLNGGAWLSDYIATGPAAPRCPWDELHISAKPS